MSARKKLKDILDDSFAMLQACPTAPRTYEDIFHASNIALRHIPDAKHRYAPFYHREYGNFLDTYHILTKSIIIPFGPTITTTYTMTKGMEKDTPTYQQTQVRMLTMNGTTRPLEHRLHTRKEGEEAQEIFRKAFGI